MFYLCCKKHEEQVIIQGNYEKLKNRSDQVTLSSLSHQRSIVKVPSHKRSNSARSVLSVETYATSNSTSTNHSSLSSPSSSYSKRNNRMTQYSISVQDYHYHNINKNNCSSSIPTIKDPFAKQSKIMKKCNNNNLLQKISGCGDGDVWVEKQCVHRGNGKKKYLFVSKNTGVVTREPPSGASCVMYVVDERKIIMEDDDYDGGGKN